MKTVKEVLTEDGTGLHYGNRVLLPFKVEILKIVIGTQIITDFSKNYDGAHVRVTDLYTEVYFYDYKNLSEQLSKYEVIKLVVVQEGEDIFDFDNHVPIELEIHGKHKLLIKKIPDDLLFFE
ncbi:MAG: hypothetical protein KKF62_09845 [Bacteroidetes bacterium]|nr:hypothetical protein [Bacteroidota bacterium]MBU1114549.1 hypothetical protein [Bacteroidota bacterium]MBU1798614.1 hypothetical protein [Bacteroidota bacterium]